jgi:hypothetical protein
VAKSWHYDVCSELSIIAVGNDGIARKPLEAPLWKKIRRRKGVYCFRAPQHSSWRAWSEATEGMILMSRWNVIQQEHLIRTSKANAIAIVLAGGEWLS